MAKVQLTPVTCSLLWLKGAMINEEHLIQRPSAVLCSTKTRDLNVLNGELVIICDLFIYIDVLFGVDDNLLLRLHSDDLCVAIRLKNKAFIRYKH